MLSVGGKMGVEVVELPGKFCQMEHTPVIKMTSGGDTIDWCVDFDEWSLGAGYCGQVRNEDIRKQ
jgi:hypothetical protein